MNAQLIIRCVAGLMLAGVSLNAQERLGPAHNGIEFYSLEKEAGLGRQLAADLRQHSTPIDNPIVQEYLDRVGQGLTVQVPDAKFPFTFSAVADDPCPPLHEPAALPGGYVFVPAGLFLAAQDEAEFAGMLAHAMEHIAQRHGTRQATRGAMNLASIPLIFMGGWSGGYCSGQLLIPMGFLTSLRSNELEADSLAVQILARAGFDPMALVRYIQRVQVRTTGTMSRTDSPLLDRDQRILALMSAIEKLPRIHYVARPAEKFAVVQLEVRSLAAPLVHSETPPSLKRKTPE